MDIFIFKIKKAFLYFLNVKMMVLHEQAAATCWFGGHAARLSCFVIGSGLL